MSGHLAVGHRAHCRTPAATRESQKEQQRHARKNSCAYRHFRFEEHPPAEFRGREPHQPVVSAGQVAQFDRRMFDDEGEGNCHHREIWSGNAQRRHRQQHPRKRTEHAGDEKGQPVVKAGKHHDRGCIGPDCEETDMTKGYLS